MIWFAVYVFLAIMAAATTASVDAEFEWTENHRHMASSLIVAALWPMAMVYMLVYRVRRRQLRGAERSDAPNPPSPTPESVP